MGAQSHSMQQRRLRGITVGNTMRPGASAAACNVHSQGNTPILTGSLPVSR